MTSCLVHSEKLINILNGQKKNMGKFMHFQEFKNIHVKVKGAERSLESEQQVTAIINILISGINYILAQVRTK